MKKDEQNTIERDIHCPYCQSDKALLISGVGETRTVLQFPDYGMKYLLSVLFTGGLYLLIHGFPIAEIKRVVEYDTYGFCPHCGKTYNASAPMAVKAAKSKSPKLYCSLKQKFLFGVCGGISEYTGLSITLVRIMMLIYSLSFFPIIIYFLLGLTSIMPNNPKQMTAIPVQEGEKNG